jgi:glutamate transport system permease protein
MSEQATLYDAPGPRARRVTLIGSIVAVAAILAIAYFFVYRPLDADEQFSMEKWGPLFDPGNEYFSQVWARIYDGFVATLTAAALAVLASIVLGTLLAVMRIQLKAAARRRWSGIGSPVGVLLRVVMVGLNALSRAFIEVFRGLPVVITILFAWLGLPELGIDFDNKLWYLVIGLVLYNMVVIGEILRSGMEGLPPGQREAADAIGLSSMQTTMLILLPQAFRVMLPALISQLVVVLKDTSLGFIIGYEEVLRVSSQVIQVLNNPIQMYVVVGTIYILINYGLSKLAGYVQRRLATGRKTRTLQAAGGAIVAPETPAAVPADATTP